MPQGISLISFLLANIHILKSCLKNCLKNRRIRALKNFLSVELQHFLKTTTLRGYPYLLAVETGNYCMLRCSLCPVGQRKTGVPRGFLSFENFKKIIDELGEYLIQISLYNWGEPLLNDDIFEMIRLAKTRGICTIMSSNLNRFDETICENLVSSGLDVLIVSLDGASQETVEKYQRGNDFAKVMRNMRMVVKAKERFDSPTPIVQWRFLVNRYNEHEIPKARKIAKRLGVILELSNMECDMGQVVFMNPSERFENIKPWLPVNEKYSMYDYKKRDRKKPLKNDCSFLWRQSVINWDGSVLPCCMIYDPKYAFGNAFAQGFKPIWNNRKYQSARKLISSGRQTEFTICSICYKNRAMV